jgi:hypothetical protein
MMALKKLSAAALSIALPLAGLAQQTPAEPAKPAEAPAAAAAPAPAPAPAPVKKDEGVKVTPYGFILVNAFWNGDALSAHDYPGQAAKAFEGGSFLMSARQSRFGVKLAAKDDALTGADLTGVIEFDFKAGQLDSNGNTSGTAAGTSGTVAAPRSTAWYNGLMRLRVASMTASWKTDAGTFAFLGGQDYGLVNPLFAESLAWVADPLFWQAGNLWRRSPQFRASYNGDYGVFGLNLAVAMLSPADFTTPVDLGAGNRSRQPNLEGRAAVTVKADKDIFGTVGVGYHTGERRYGYVNADNTGTNVRADLVGVDADLNLTQYLQAKGEWYQDHGADDTYNGIASVAVGPTTGTTLASTKVKGDGFWAQGILKPIPAVWVTVGYGEAKANAANLTAAGATATSSRTKNTQLEAGIIVNAGKYWRFGVEGLKVETSYLDNSPKQDATQIAVSSQLKF